MECRSNNRTTFGLLSTSVQCMLDIAERLAKAAPNNAICQHNLGMLQGKIGNLLEGCNLQPRSVRLGETLKMSAICPSF